MSFEQTEIKNNKVDADFKLTFDENVKKYNRYISHADANLESLSHRVSNLVLASGGDNPNQVIDACTDVFGNIHGTLKDRLDSDFRLLNQRLNQYEEKLKSYDQKIIYFDEQLKSLYDQKAETITIYVSSSRGNDSTAEGTEEKPFKTIQAAVNTIPVINAASYIIELDKGSYLENVDVFNIQNSSIEIRGYNYASLSAGTVDTGVYVRSISFNNCSGYLSCRGLTLVDTKNAYNGFSFGRCKYGVVDRCSAQENTKGTSYVTVSYNGAGGHIYDCVMSNQETIVLSSFTSNVVFAWGNSGSNNTNVLKANRAIIFDNNTNIAGAKLKESGGQIF